MGEFLERLKQRKLVQWALAYVAAAFALIQVLDVVAQRFGWSEDLERLLIIAIAVGFFVTLVLAWYHGEKGAQKVTTRELLALSAVLTIGGGLLWHFEHESLVDPVTKAASATPAAESIDSKSIAVLPFTDLSPTHDQEYFSDGMAEEILNALAQVRDLKVAGRTSSFHFKGTNEDLRTIGRALSVASVLEGSVRKQGDKVRITAQLIQASNGFHLWSNSYDGDLKDVFEVQERIARAITDQLQVVLVGNQRSRLVPVATTSSDAHELYLQATAVFNRRDGAKMPDAIAKLQVAIGLDPNFARAHARLAALSTIVAAYTEVDQEQALVTAEQEANVAIGLDATLAEPHAALGTMYQYRRHWLAAYAESERATTLDPNDSNAMFWRGLALADAGYVKDGVAAIDRALAIDPLLPNALAWRSFWYFNAGDKESARRNAQLSIDQGLLAGERYLGLISHAEGRDGDAILQFGRGIQYSLAGLPDQAGASIAQGLFGNANQRAKAVEMIDTYLASHSRDVSPGAPWALLLLGEPARALAVGQDPRTINDTLFTSWLWSQWGATARKLPQFSEFARKMGLSELWDQRGPPDSCRRESPGNYACG